MKESTKQWIDWLKSNGATRIGTLTPEQNNEVKRQLSALPHFSDETSVEGVVYYVGAEYNPREQSELRVCIYIYDEAAQVGGWWRGSLADTYGTGNDSNKTRKQKTMEALARVGVQDFRQLPSLIGKTIPIWVKGREYNGQTYYDIASIGSTSSVPDSVSLNLLFGPTPASASAAPAPAPAAPAAAPAPASSAAATPIPPAFQ